jgi:pimeloyl-ACP methyl ester carboxylesterase
MPHATRNGCRLYYDFAGDGATTLVLIRGLARSSSYWGPLLPLLAPRLRLLLVDNRGVGRSDARPPYSTRELADDIAAVMDAAGVDRAHVFGMSLGGMIAQELALAHPSRIDRLVLGCTTPGGKRAKKTPLSSRIAMLGSAFGRHDRVFAMLASDDSLRARPEIRERWLALGKSERVPPRALLGQALAALRHDAFDRVAQIAAPTLVITGDDDAIIDPENSRLLAAAIPNARLVLLPGARHDFTTDRPDDAARAIVEFLLP